MLTIKLNDLTVNPNAVILDDISQILVEFTTASRIRIQFFQHPELDDLPSMF